jgi:hypothetical protein
MKTTLKKDDLVKIPYNMGDCIFIVVNPKGANGLVELKQLTTTSEILRYDRDSLNFIGYKGMRCAVCNKRLNLKKPFKRFSQRQFTCIDC